MHLVSRIRQTRRTPLLQVAKTSAAVVVAWFASVALLQQPLPIFAAIAALLVVLPSVNQSLVRGLERSVGVVAGVLIAFAAGQLFGASTWIVLSIVVVSLLVSWALRLTPSSANQVPISAMLVLAIGAQTPDYALDRVLETVIGAVVALAINALVVPPVLLAPAHLAVGRLTRDLAAVLDELGAVLSTPSDRERLGAVLVQARGLRDLQAKAAAAVAAGEESLMLNPRASRQRTVLEADAALLVRLTALVHRAVGMTRSVHDNYDVDLVDDPAVGQIAEELHRAAHDLRLRGREAEAGSAPASSGPSPDERRLHGQPPLDGERPVLDAGDADTRPDAWPEAPALTAPVRVLRPDPEHWVLIGSLLEDIRRVREEIIDE